MAEQGIDQSDREKVIQKKSNCSIQKKNESLIAYTSKSCDVELLKQKNGHKPGDAEQTYCNSDLCTLQTRLVAYPFTHQIQRMNTTK